LLWVEIREWFNGGCLGLGEYKGVEEECKNFKEVNCNRKLRVRDEEG
jgi:hypothetical protein